MRKESGSTNLNTYITDHLPAKFQEQQKLLLPYYKEAFYFIFISIFIFLTRRKATEALYIG